MGWFAEKMGMSNAMMSNYANTRVMPSPTNLVRLHDMTNGGVSIEDMVRQYADQNPRPSRKKESTKAKDSI